MASSNSTPLRPSTTSPTAEAAIQNTLRSPPRRKERRNPSVTPRRFARFFGTPLGQGSSHHGLEGGSSGSSRVALGDVDGSAINSQSTRVKRKLFDNELSASNPSLPPPEPLTKRTRTEPNTQLFSDENIPALSHRWQTCDFAEVSHTPRSILAGRSVDRTQDDELPSSPCMPSSPPAPTFESDSHRSKTLVSWAWKISLAVTGN